MSGGTGELRAEKEEKRKSRGWRLGMNGSMALAWATGDGRLVGSRLVI
jgi:hypothetical protein